MRSQDRETHSVRACPVEIHMDMLQAQCRPPIPAHPFCASLRSQNAHGHFTRAFTRVVLYGTVPDPASEGRNFYGNLKAKMHMDASQDTVVR